MVSVVGLTILNIWIAIAAKNVCCYKIIVFSFTYSPSHIPFSNARIADTLAADGNDVVSYLFDEI
jgi:hypothetical protein